MNLGGKKAPDNPWKVGRTFSSTSSTWVGRNFQISREKNLKFS
jgi:hypothetical protein